MFGVSEFSSRLPIALATLGLMFATLLLGKFTFGGKAGFYSALCVGSCVGIFLFTRVLWPDVILTLLITMVFYCFLRALEDLSRSRYVYGIYVFGALAVLTKGLVGAAFPGIIILAYLLITGELRRLAQLKIFTGARLFLAIAAPWHIAALIPSLMVGRLTCRVGVLLVLLHERTPAALYRQALSADYDTVPRRCFRLARRRLFCGFFPLVATGDAAAVRNLNREERITLFW
jgi:4-amino-4-deoxy-L-arabinose transferase-like glycosyltransferase